MEVHLIMELTKQQMEVVIFALDREIDLERMSEEDIADFIKIECGTDPIYIFQLQKIVDLFQNYLTKGESK